MSEIVKKPIKITETILRDAHQSLIATRMSTDLMLPILEKMDKVGYHSVAVIETDRINIIKSNFQAVKFRGKKAITYYIFRKNSTARTDKCKFRHSAKPPVFN